MKKIEPIKYSSISVGEFMNMRYAQMGLVVEPYHEPAQEWEVTAKDRRGKVTERLLSQGHYGCIGPMPEKLSKAIGWLQSYLDAVPEKSRASAKIEIESEGGYEGEHHVEMTISYERPETDEEWAARKADVEARLAVDIARREQADRAEFERLQAKFATEAH